MISEVDIRDWLDKCKKADKGIDNCEPYPWDTLDFIDQVRDYFKSQQKQVAALFKRPEGK